MLGKKSKKKPQFTSELDHMRPLLLERADFQCEVQIPKICRGRGLVVHHRKLRSQGGTNHPINLLVLCDACHRRVHDFPGLSYAAGWLVRSFEDPVEVTFISYRRGSDATV